MARFVVSAPLILLLASVASAQNLPKSDPKAVSLATQAIAALANNVARLCACDPRRVCATGLEPLSYTVVLATRPGAWRRSCCSRF